METTTNGLQHPRHRAAREHHLAHAAALRRGRAAAAQPGRQNGYRYYDADALVRLQRVLLLRELGSRHPGDRRAARGSDQRRHGARESPGVAATEQKRIARQIASVQNTIEELKGGEQIMAEDMPHAMFDGFDHTAVQGGGRREVGRGGVRQERQLVADKTDDEKAEWKAAQSALQSDWIEAATSGADPAGDVAHALAQRQFDAWLAPGTPGYSTGGPIEGVLHRPWRDVRRGSAVREELRRRRKAPSCVTRCASTPSASSRSRSGGTGGSRRGDRDDRRGTAHAVRAKGEEDGHGIASSP